MIFTSIVEERFGVDHILDHQ